jgi:hypothetical protein
MCTCDRYELGGGVAEIFDDTLPPLSDNIWHHVRLERKGRKGQLQIDGGQIVRRESPGILAMLDTNGNVFFGLRAHAHAPAYTCRWRDKCCPVDGRTTDGQLHRLHR